MPWNRTAEGWKDEQVIYEEKGGRVCPGLIGFVWSKDYCMEGSAKLKTPLTQTHSERLFTISFLRTIGLLQ